MKKSKILMINNKKSKNIENVVLFSRPGGILIDILTRNFMKF